MEQQVKKKYRMFLLPVTLLVGCSSQIMHYRVQSVYPYQKIREEFCFDKKKSILYNDSFRVEMDEIDSNVYLVKQVLHNKYQWLDLETGDTVVIFPDKIYYMDRESKLILGN